MLTARTDTTIWSMLFYTIDYFTQLMDDGWLPHMISEGAVEGRVNIHSIAIALGVVFDLCSCTTTGSGNCLNHELYYMLRINKQTTRPPSVHHSQSSSCSSIPAGDSCTTFHSCKDSSIDSSATLGFSKTVV